MTTAIVHTEVVRDLARSDEEWSVAQIVAQTKKIKECMSAVMIRDEHYGVIPGTGSPGRPAKPTLLKPGAEKLCLMFRLCPEYETTRAEQTSTLVAYTVRCTLTHIPSQNRIATGMGSCNSREKKYTRPADRKCPSCGKETIIKGKDEYGGGWLCFAKKGGCGAKFKDGDESVEKQDLGLADPSDLDNTILKMACKRALVAAVLNGTAASDCFTQDLEDLTEKAAEYVPPPVRETPERIAGTHGEAPQGVSPLSVSSSAPTAPANGASVSMASAIAPASKPPVNYVAGNKVPVKAGDPMANPGQVQRVHVLVGDIGLDDATYRGTWLKAYKTHDGKQVTSSKQMTFDQLSNLIRRMEAQKARNSTRHENMERESSANLAAIIPPAADTSIDDLFQKAFDTDDEQADWLRGLWAVEHPKELDEKETATALQLLICMSQGPDVYEAALTKARERSLVR